MIDCAAPKVLIVDDDPDVLKITSAMLTLGGVDAITALSVEEAMSKLRHGTFDVCLVDGHLPGGWKGAMLPECFSKIRPEMRSIIVSGSSAEDLGLPETYRDFLQKPYSLNQLLAKVAGEEYATQTN